MRDDTSDRLGQTVGSDHLSEQFGHGQTGTLGDISPSVRPRDGTDTWPPLKGGLFVRPKSGLCVRETHLSTETDG